MILDFGKLKWKEIKSQTISLGTKENPPVHAFGSCGCISTSLKDRELTITYNAGRVPKHFKFYGITVRKINNNVTVKFQDGTYDKIILKGFVE